MWYMIYEAKQNIENGVDITSVENAMQLMSVEAMKKFSDDVDKIRIKILNKNNKIEEMLSILEENNISIDELLIRKKDRM